VVCGAALALGWGSEGIGSIEGGVDISTTACEATGGIRIGQCVICSPVCDSAHTSPTVVHRYSIALTLLLLALIPIQAQEPAARIVLQPGDAIRVTVWREPSLSGDFLVTERGESVLPVLGIRQVAGRPWNEVRDSLRAAFARQLSQSDIGLTPLRRVYVFGSVDKPGIYFAEPLGTFSQIIAIAGGVTEDGDPSSIRVVRDGRTVIPRLALDAAMAPEDLTSGDQIFVERRGWFDRNSAAVIGAGAGLLGVIATLLIIR